MPKKREKAEETFEERLNKALVPNDEIPYKVPNNWLWTRLGETGNYKKGPFGSSLTKSMFVPKGENTVKVYEQKNAIQKDWTLGSYYITEDYFNQAMTSFEVKEDDIIVSCAGTIGETYIMPKGIEKGIINQALMKIELNQNIDKKYYLFYFDYTLKGVSNTLSNGSAIKNIPPFKIFKELPFALPPIEEQKRIVNKLDYFFDKIQRVKDIIEEVSKKNEARKESILSKAFTGELTAKWRADNNCTNVDVLLKNIEDEKQTLIKEKVIKNPPKMEPLTEKDFFLDIPKNWKYIKLNDIAFVTKLAGFEYTKNIYPNLVDKGIPLFKGKNIQNGRIVYEFESYIPEEVSNELIRSQVNKKCLLTPYVGTIGNVALFEGEFKAHLGSNVGKIELFNNFNQNILEEYMLYYFRSCYGLAQLKKHKKATAQESISIEAIRDCVVIVPPIEEQKEIVRILDNIFTKENTIKELISLEDKIQILEKSILDKAFRGELGTHSDDDIDALELLKDILNKN